MVIERYIQREVIHHNDFEYHVSTTSADRITWMGAYACGYREPRYPVPAIPTEVRWEHWEWGKKDEMVCIIIPWIIPDWDSYGIVILAAH